MALAARLEAVSTSGGVIDKYAGDPGRVETAYTATADIFLGAFVKYDSDGKVALANAGDGIAGIVIGAAQNYTDLSKDSDSPFDADTPVLVYKYRPGDVVYATSDTNGTISAGDPVQITAGKVKAFAYTDGVETTDTLEGVVGHALESVTATSGTEKILRIEIGGV